MRWKCNKYIEGSASGITYDWDKFKSVKYSINSNGSEEFVFGTIACQRIEVEAFEEDLFNVGDSVNWGLYEGDNHQFFGTFECRDKSKNKKTFKYIFYDTLNRANTTVDGWYNGVSYPITMERLAQGLASSVYCSVHQTGGNPDLQYGGLDIKEKAFNATNLNGYTVLRWMGQCLGSFWVQEASDTWLGARNLVWNSVHYKSTTSLSVDNSWYTFADLSLNPVERIGGIKFKKNNDADNNVGHYYTGGSNEMFIDASNRWYLSRFKQTGSIWDERGQWLANYLYNQGTTGYTGIGVGAYYTGTVKTNQWNTLKVGDRIKVDGRDFLIMEVDIEESGWTFKCFGQYKRSENTSLQEEIVDVPPIPEDIVTETDLGKKGIGVGGTGGDTPDKGFNITTSQFNGQYTPSGEILSNSQTSRKHIQQAGGSFDYNKNSVVIHKDTWPYKTDTVHTFTATAQTFIVAADYKFLVLALKSTSNGYILYTVFVPWGEQRIQMYIPNSTQYIAFTLNYGAGGADVDVDNYTTATNIVRVQQSAGVSGFNVLLIKVY